MVLGPLVHPFKHPVLYLGILDEFGRCKGFLSLVEVMCCWEKASYHKCIQHLDCLETQVMVIGKVDAHLVFEVQLHLVPYEQQRVLLFECF